MGLPAAIIRDFTQTLGKQLLGAGFEVINEMTTNE
jgi:hypothetical protein